MKTLKDNYHAVIIGGGITGAGIFRDLARHGVDCLLIDKKDFASQTSANSSKMFHGGIRYLESLNLGLVWEALHEKNLWLQLTPHLCQEVPFFLPVFKESKYPRWMTKIALLLYDILSCFKNTPHKIVGKKQLAQEIPWIKKEQLRGAGIYYDAIVDDSKITLENIYDALLENNAAARNYTELIDLKLETKELLLKDSLTGETKSIHAQEVIFATGPFTDQVLSKIPALKWKERLLPSKGSHLWLKNTKLPLRNAMVLQTNDGRIIFVIPQKGQLLVGTTEQLVSGDFFDLKASHEEIHYLLETVQHYFPGANITENDILGSFAGIRPLVRVGNSQKLGKVARNHKIIYPMPWISVIIGGKLTTFRTMGQPISRRIVRKMGKKYSPQLTKTPLRQHSIIKAFAPFTLPTIELLIKIVQSEHVRTFEDLVKRRLGIPSKTHWPAPQDFDQFFLEVLPQLAPYLSISQEDIRSYQR